MGTYETHVSSQAICHRSEAGRLAIPTYSSALLPTTNGLTFGSAALRWTAYLQDVDIAGTPTFASRIGTKNLDGILFADQFAGATVGDQIDAAVTAAVGGLVVAPPDMGAGFGAIPGLLLDLRAGAFTLWQNGYTTPTFSANGSGIISGAFVSGTSGPAGTGAIRLANADAIKFRNGIFDRNAMTFSGNTVSVGTLGVQLNGAVTFTGAASGITTLGVSGQISSSLATGTAPFSITSTTLVPNLNVATLNGVTVSGTPTTGQSLVATGTTTAAWSGSAGVYKMESMQYTPNTFVSSAGGALFTYSLPANELALNQALRISSTGTWTNTSGVTRTYTFTLKAGSTTLYTWALTSSATSVSNLPWGITFLAICTASGSSGTLEVQMVDQQRITGTTNPTALTPTPNTATIAFDTTSIQSLTLNVVQTNDATTATTGRQFMVERLG